MTELIYLPIMAGDTPEAIAFNYGFTIVFWFGYIALLMGTIAKILNRS